MPGSPTHWRVKTSPVTCCWPSPTNSTQRSPSLIGSHVSAVPSRSTHCVETASPNARRLKIQEFISTRFKAATAPLREKLRKALAKEAQDRWRTEAEPVELQVAQAADLLIEVYPRCAHELIRLFELMKKTDKAVAAVNSRIPAGCSPLRGVEMVARKIDGFLPSELRIAEKCALPGLSVGHGKGSTLLVWPPPVPSVTLQYYESVHSAIVNARPSPTELERARRRGGTFRRARQTRDERQRELRRNEAAARSRANEDERRRIAAGA
jgi:hypothetical protein